MENLKKHNLNYAYRFESCPDYKRLTKVKSSILTINLEVSVISKAGEAPEWLIF
jgi:hypothetical protein